MVLTFGIEKGTIARCYWKFEDDEAYSVPCGYGLEFS